MAAMVALTKSICWRTVVKSRDANKIGVVIYQKPTTNSCYLKRKTNEPHLCSESDGPRSPWYIFLLAFSFLRCACYLLVICANVCGQDKRFVPSWVLVALTYMYYFVLFSLSGTHLSIVASLLLFQVQVEEITGPFHGLKDLTKSIQLHLTTLPFRFLKKKLILIQTIGRTLFQKYILMNLQLIGLVFAMLWT